MTIFFTSDLHFGHRAMAEMRGFQDTDAMDAHMKATWNSQVAPSDMVYILGDFSFHKKDTTLHLLRTLNGSKILVKGNHDKFNEEMKKEASEFHLYLEKPFKTPSADKQHVCMFHFPIANWNRKHHGAYHLHGHSHGRDSGITGKCLDVGWDVHKKLLTLEAVHEIMSTK